LGYYDLAGDLTAPQALDLLTKEDYTLIDVRTDKEKVKSGVPSLPRNIKNKLFALPIEELSGKLRGQLRNARKVEAEVTAIKISSLKRVNKGSKIVIIDSDGFKAGLALSLITCHMLKSFHQLVSSRQAQRGSFPVLQRRRMLWM
jgi:hypothetical protein